MIDSLWILIVQLITVQWRGEKNTKKDDVNVIAGLVYLDENNIPKRSDPDSKTSKNPADKHTISALFVLYYVLNLMKWTK